MDLSSLLRLLRFAPFIVVVACSGGGDDTTNGDGGSSVTTGTGNPPGTSCITSEDGGSRSFSSRVCAPNPAFGQCRFCITTASGSDSQTCEYACRIGGSDCPSGKTCVAQPNGSRSSGGNCRDFGDPDALGFCK